MHAHLRRFRAAAVLAVLFIGLTATAANAALTSTTTRTAANPGLATNSSGCTFTYQLFVASNFARTSTSGSCASVKVRHFYNPGGPGVWTSWQYSTSVAQSPSNANISNSEHRGCYAVACNGPW